MSTRFGSEGVPIEHLAVSAYKVPTDAPESDGTYQWKATTLVLVEVQGGGRSGLGYSYADTATAILVRDMLAEVVRGRNAMDVPGVWEALRGAIRNLGRPGIASMAISAVDGALWDLKAKLLDLPLASLLGQVHEAIRSYGSGGFTSYDDKQLRDQLGGWAEQGFTMVKMKVGRDPSDDPRRVTVARQAIGPNVALFVDANGALDRKQALAMAEVFHQQGITWFEEPVTSDDLAGLRLLRDRGPSGMAIAAGEYGYDLFYFRRMLEAETVDVLQADATRCGGITGFLRVGMLCEAWGIPLSAHCAPSLHLPVCCACPSLRHLEYFHDHDRIEHWLFDGAPVPRDGWLRPDLSRAGLGLEFKKSDASPFIV